MKRLSFSLFAAVLAAIAVASLAACSNQAVSPEQLLGQLQLLSAVPLGHAPVAGLWPNDISALDTLPLATGMVLSPANLKMLEQAFRASFAKGIERVQHPWGKIAMTVPSTTGENVYAWLADNFQIREWIGERQYQNLSTYNYVVPNKDFEGTVKVHANKIKDDQFGIYAPMFEQMGESVNQFPAKLVFQALKNGNAALCYDGQFFFDTDHPVGLPGKEVSVANDLGGAGTAWFLLSTKKVVKPLIWQPREAFQMVMKNRPTDENVFNTKEFVFGVDGRANVGYGLWQYAFRSRQTLDATNVRAALVAMASQVGNNGEPLDIEGDTLVVPPSLAEIAKDLNTKEFLSNGETNTLRGRFDVISTGWVA